MPSSPPLRPYQLAMAHSALFHNTLVCLPTGLGKTLIAAVAMFNFYRWFPRGKVVFLAPTRPLVEQQCGACTRVMGIPPVRFLCFFYWGAGVWRPAAARQPSAH